MAPAGPAAAFASGAVPDPPQGAYGGTPLAVTLAPGLDALVEVAARVWMPWRGKRFDRDGAEGWNLLTAAGAAAARVAFPGYPGVRRLPEGGAEAFRFRTSLAPSTLDPTRPVLRVDYRPVPENPRWPVRRLLDELVALGGGRLLGQALVEHRGRLHRYGWFVLER